MTENGDPYENAIAERVNGILKDEFGLYDKFENILQAKGACQAKYTNIQSAKTSLELLNAYA